MQSKHLIVVDNANFDQVLGTTDGVVLVDFWADWCGPCRLLGPLLPKLAVDYAGKLTIAKFDTEANKGDDSIRSRFDFEGIPALLFFRNGVEVARIVGFAPYEEMKQMFAAELSKLGIEPNQADEAAEATFVAAVNAALERHEAATTPAMEKIEAAMAPVSAEWTPKLEAAQAKVEASEMEQAEFDELQRAYRTAASAAYGPFMREYKEANATALVAYEAEIAEALAAFEQSGAPAAAEETSVSADGRHCEGGVCKL